MSQPPAPLRRRVERSSKPLLVRLHRQPRVAIPLATLALVALGLFAPLPYALPALAVVLAFLVWITYLSWPAVPTSGRLIRLLMIGLLLVGGATRLTSGG